MNSILSMFSLLPNNEFLFLFVGDGDSSVTQKLAAVVPYGVNLPVSKIEFSNHLIRSYCNRISELTNIRRLETLKASTS